jgi:hypothetical protein
MLDDTNLSIEKLNFFWASLSSRIKLLESVKQKQCNSLKCPNQFSGHNLILPTNDFDFFDASNQLISTTGIPRDTAQRSFTVRRTWARRFHGYDRRRGTRRKPVVLIECGSTLVTQVNRSSDKWYRNQTLG